MSFKIGDIVQRREGYGATLFEILAFLPPPKWKPERDVRLRVVWKRSEDYLPSWPIGSTTVTCEHNIVEPDGHALLVVALAANVKKRSKRRNG